MKGSLQMDKSTTRLGQEKIFPLLIKLSVPSTFAMLVSALYNIVDAIFVGRGVSTEALGGLAVAFPVQMIIMSVGFLIGVGASSIISRSLGAGDHEKSRYALGNAYTAGTIIAVVIVIISIFNLNSLVRIFGATKELEQYARDYLQIILFAGVIHILAIISNNIMRAQGNAKTAMMSMVSGALMNMILDPIFIFVLHMGIKGAALATAISQCVTLIVGLAYVFGKKSTIHVTCIHFRIRAQLLKEMTAIGFSNFIRQIAGSIVVAVLNNVINTVTGGMATLYISVFGIINRVMAFMMMPMFGVVQAFLPIAGYNYGAKSYKRVRESIKVTLIILLLLGTVSTLVILLVTRQVLGIFTNDVAVLKNGPVILRTVIYITPLVGFHIITSTLYQAIGKAGPALFLALLRQLIVLIPLLLLLPRFLGSNGIWLSFPLADSATVIISLIMLRHEAGLIKKNQLEYMSA